MVALKPSTCSQSGSAWPTMSLAAALTLGSVLIAVGARGDLWLDEVWSVLIAKDAGSIGGIFRLAHDNNHPLNTLWLYLLGDRAPLYLYRLPAVLCGVVSLGLVAIIARRRGGPAASIVATLLAGASFPLILYFSEARGYAPAMCLALLACWLIEGDKTPSPRRWRVLLYWIVSILGMLAHATFLIWTLSALAADMFGCLEAPQARAERLRRLLRFHLIPLTFAAAWYRLFWGRMIYGGGPPYRTIDVVAEACAMLTGIPRWTGDIWLQIGLTVALLSAIFIVLWRDRRRDAVLLLCLLVAVPSLLIAVTHPRFLFFRYFVVAFPFFYIAAGRAIASAKPRPRVVAVIGLLIAASVAGHSLRTARLLQSGRGHYADAVRWMATRSPSGHRRVACSNPPRDRLMLEFYAARVAPGTSFEVVTMASNSEPDYYLAESPGPELVQAERKQWHRVATFKSSPVSGWTWSVYQPSH